MSQNEIHMDQKIFTMNLSVNTVSVYLSCCGLLDTETPLTRDNISEVWSESAELLDQGLSELTELNILTLVEEDKSETRTYALNGAANWKS